MQARTAEARYQLTILNYPDVRSIPNVCRIVYESEDKNLIASLSTLPYVVGRSFSMDESMRLHESLKHFKVGHRLESKDPEVPPFSFDPSMSAAPPMAKVIDFKAKKKARIRTKLWLWIFSAVALTILAFVSYKHWSSTSSSNAQIETAPIENYEAKIEDFVRDVEYRLSQDLLWKKASPNAPLQSQDSLRTFKDSTAHLRYREGSRVTVLPNTFLVIGKKQAEDHQTIQLTDGSLQARMKPASPARKISIETASGTLEMESPKSGEAKEVKVETSISKGTLTVAVTQGTAVLSPKAGQEAVTIGALQQVTATPEQVSPPQAFKPTIHLRSPVVDSKLQVNPQKGATFAFEWEPIGDQADYELLLATDVEAKDILLRQSSKNPKVELTYLDLGTLYWRVLGHSDGVAFESPVRRLYVEKSGQ